MDSSVSLSRLATRQDARLAPGWVKAGVRQRLAPDDPTLTAWSDIQKHLDAVAALLDVEIVLIDASGYCVAGTGPYREGLGARAPEDNALSHSLQSGQSTMVLNPGLDAVCQGCSSRTQCGDVANFTGPVFAGERIVAVVQIVAFTDNQRAELLTKAEQAFTLIRQLIEVVCAARPDPRPQESGRVDEIAGESACMRSLKQTILKAAASDATVLVQGESGTGKELVAQAVHAHSARRNGPFVAINCGAIPESLMESELFGYESGAFSGAAKAGSPGLLEQACGGTFFLDEVSEMPPSLQVKMLRVLQERKVRRVGGKTSIPVDARIIAACNVDLRARVRQGLFREDLFFRLDVIPLSVPPLRERAGDVRLLVTHFLQYFSLEKGCTFRVTTDLMHQFEQYSWPGNVRELKNFVEYGVNLCDNRVLTQEIMAARFAAAGAAQGQAQELAQEHVQAQSQSQPQPQPLPSPQPACALCEPDADSPQMQERQMLRALITRHGPHTEGKKAMARELGVSLATLYRKLKAARL